MDLKFNKDCLFVSFEVVGDSNVDIVGYVTGLDGQKLLSLKEAMELPDASDDEDYKEEGESEKEEEKDESEEEKEEGESEEKEDSKEEEKEEEEEEEEEKEESEEKEEEKEEEEEKEPIEEAPRNAVDFNQPVFLSSSPSPIGIQTSRQVYKVPRYREGHGSVAYQWPSRSDFLPLDPSHR